MPTKDAFAWHEAALRGEKPATTYEPQVGFYLRKDESGFMTPCSIWLEQPIDEETGELLGDEQLCCECGGVTCDATDVWMFLAKRAISRDEYLARMAALITGENLTDAF